MKFTLRKVLLILVWLLTGISMIGGAAMSTYITTLETHQQTISSALLQARDHLPALAKNEVSIRRDYEEENRLQAKMIAILQKFNQEELVPDEEDMKEYADLLDASYIAISDAQGTVLTEYGEKLITEGSDAGDYIPEVDEKVLEGMTEEEKDTYYDMIFVSSGLVLTQDAGDTVGYRLKLKEGYDLYFESSNRRAAEMKDEIYSWRAILHNISLPENAYYIVISKTDGTILVHPDEEMVGKGMAEMGYDSKEKLLADYPVEGKEGIFYNQDPESIVDTGMETLHNTKLASGLLQGEWMYVICQIPNKDTFVEILLSIWYILLPFAIGSFLILAYVWFVLDDWKDNGLSKEDESSILGSDMLFYQKGRLRRLFVVCILIMVCTFFFSLQLQLLSNSLHSNQERKQVKKLEKEIEEKNENQREAMGEWYNERNLKTARIVSYIIAQDDSLKTREAMKKMKKGLGVSDVFLFDQAGKLSVTSSNYDHIDLYEKNTLKKAISRTFRPLLDGKTENAWTPVSEKKSKETEAYAGLSVRNKEDLCDGCVGISRTPLFAVTSEGDSMFSDTLSWAKDAGTYYSKGLTVNQLKNVSAIILRLTLFMLLSVVIGSFYWKRRGKKDSEDDVERPEEESCGEESEEPDKKKKTKRSGKALFSKKYAKFANDFEEMLLDHSRGGKDPYFSQRWSYNSTPMSSRSPEGKMRFLLGVILIVAALWILFMKAVSDFMVDAGYMADIGIFADILSGDWERGLSLYSITAAEMILILAGAATLILHRLVFVLARFSSTRGETLCHLANSIISYTAILVSLFYILALFGVDTKTILASAGILGIVVGMGAKDTIADIMAGIFLIFEDVIHVGDYIVLGDKAGVIMNIGVRMTRIRNDGTIITVNNSDIKSAKNLSCGDARIVCMVTVSSEEDLLRVKEVIEKELPEISRRLREGGHVTSDLFFKGVEAFDSKSYTLNFDIFCESGRVKRITRMVNEEVMLMFQRNNIKRL